MTRTLLAAALAAALAVPAPAADPKPNVIVEDPPTPDSG